MPAFCANSFGLFFFSPHLNFTIKFLHCIAKIRIDWFFLTMRHFWKNQTLHSPYFQTLGTFYSSMPAQYRSLLRQGIVENQQNKTKTGSGNTHKNSVYACIALHSPIICINKHTGILSVTILVYKVIFTHMWWKGKIYM